MAGRLSRESGMLASFELYNIENASIHRSTKSLNIYEVEQNLYSLL